MNVEAVPAQDWPVDALLDARAVLEVWATEHGVIEAGEMLTLDLRCVRRRDTPDAPFGVAPRDMALTVVYDADRRAQAVVS